MEEESNRVEVFLVPSLTKIRVEIEALVVMCKCVEGRILPLPIIRWLLARFRGNSMYSKITTEVDDVG